MRPIRELAAVVAVHFGRLVYPLQHNFHYSMSLCMLTILQPTYQFDHTIGLKKLGKIHNRFKFLTPSPNHLYSINSVTRRLYSLHHLLLVPPLMAAKKGTLRNSSTNPPPVGKLQVNPGYIIQKAHTACYWSFPTMDPVAEPSTFNGVFVPWETASSQLHHHHSTIQQP